MRVTAIWQGEEMEVLFSAYLSRDDIGGEIPHYVDVIEDIEIEEVSIWGTPLPLESLPAKLRDEIMALANGMEFEA